MIDKYSSRYDDPGMTEEQKIFGAMLFFSDGDGLEYGINRLVSDNNKSRDKIIIELMKFLQ